MTGPNSGGVLLQPPPAKINGGQQYAMRLRTDDGDEHILVYDLNVPVDEGGKPDLARAAEISKNPAVEGLRNIVQMAANAQMAALAAAVGRNVGNVSPVIQVEGGVMVFLAHITSAEHLGEVKGGDERTQSIVVKDVRGKLARYSYATDREES